MGLFRKKTRPLDELEVGQTGYCRISDFIIYKSIIYKRISSEADTSKKTSVFMIRLGARFSPKQTTTHLIPVLRKTEDLTSLCADGRNCYFNVRTGFSNGYTPVGPMHAESVGVSSSDGKEDSQSSTGKVPAKKSASGKRSMEELLAPLDSIFLQPGVLDEAVLHLNIPNLALKAPPKYSGVVLYGPPGTGKTVLMRAIAKVYQNFGAYACEGHFSKMTERYVGTLGSNLENLFQKVLREAKDRNLPSFLYFDESTSLVQDVEGDHTSANHYYQEGLDVMKKYIGNYPELVVCVSTNGELEEFEGAIIREGRMKPIRIDFPRKEERKAMWQYFTREHELGFTLTDEQAMCLAEAIPEEQGAFIEDFCSTYTGNKRVSLLKERAQSETILDALKSEVNVTDEEVRHGITYENILCDVKQALTSKAAAKKRRTGF